MNVAKIVLTYVLELYLLVLIVRLIFSWIQAYSRDWQPHGFVLVIAESVYTATDPPLKVLRRYIPTPRLGRVAIDLSFMALFFLVLVLLTVVGQL